MKIDHLSKEEKDKIIHYLMRCFRQAQMNICYLEECDLVMERIEDYRSDKKTCLLVQRILVEMDKDLRDILEWEFLEKRGNKEMMEKHSRSNYYRLRNQAVDDFLRCL